MSDIIEGKNISTKFTLPTKGEFYKRGDGSLRFPDGMVTVSTMTTKEEKILAGGGGRTSVRLDTLLQRCVGLGDMDPAELTLEDRMFLLIVIRSMSYGSRYDYDVKCPSCGKRSKHTVDLLEDLPVTYIDELTEEPIEPFEVGLPFCKNKVGFRLLRGADEAAVEKFVEQQNRRNVEIGDPGYTYRLARHIVEIDGESVGLQKAIHFVESLLSKDSLAFRDAIEAKSPGVKLEIEFHCPFTECDSVTDIRLPMQAEFFRPRSK